MGGGCSDLFLRVLLWLCVVRGSSSTGSGPGKDPKGGVISTCWLFPVVRWSLMPCLDTRPWRSSSCVRMPPSAPWACRRGGPEWALDGRLCVAW
jgi:hypothetical protein